MLHAAILVLLLAFALAGADGASAADWAVKSLPRTDGPGVRCVLESGRLSIPDGYQKTTVYITVAPKSVAITSVSPLDGGFSDIGLEVDGEELVKLDKLGGDKTALFDSKYDRLVARFKAGTSVRAQLRFWPTWPATGTHSAEFTLIGFTKAFGELAACR